MKVYRTPKLEIEYLHLFLYGLPGAGKTKFIGDFEAAGQTVMRVGEIDRVTLPALGLDVVSVLPSTENELRAFTECPEVVVEKVLRPLPGLENFTPKTIAFDNLRVLQRVVFGTPEAREDDKVFEGAFTMPTRKATGIMALPNKRDATGIPANKDYRLLDEHMRSLIHNITSLPYHTIVTSHEERDLSIESRLKLSGDAERDAMVSRTTSGYPALDGFSLKYDLGGLISDFFIRLEWTGDQYLMHTRPNAGFHSRTRINQVMPPTLDWTGKNAYHLLRRKIEQAQEKAGQKR